MKNLFIDSNIWLSLYHFTNDDLVQFGKLKELIGKDIKLLIPHQVHDEIYRNREAKLKDAFKSFEIKSIQYPAFCKEYAEYKQFSADYSNIIFRHKQWVKKINEDVINQSLPADKTIQDFFSVSGLIDCDFCIDKAYMRFRIGNPPGKDNKYGDAINWECLLATVPEGEDLYLISSDKDYKSGIFEDRINPFLMAEWQEKKKSNIYFYTNLVPFLSEHFKNIELKTEQDKQNLIDRLFASPNFETTHGIVAMMRKHVGWTDNQIERICLAATTNSQVAWILYDEDILSFYCDLLSHVDQRKIKEPAVKRILEEIANAIVEKEAEARDCAKAEADDAIEEFFKH